jgi:hypothetical protein
MKTIRSKEQIAPMDPTRDEDLISNPAIRLAVEVRRAAEPDQTPARRWPIGWLLAGFAIGMLLIGLIGLIR